MTDSKTPASEVAALQPSPKGLGVLKAAFRERALSTHPDHGGDPDEFRALYRAYERLLAKHR